MRPRPAAARLAAAVHPGANVRPRSSPDSGVRFTIAISATRRARSKRPLPIIDASWRR
jgi:hypothetical protein